MKIIYDPQTPKILEKYTEVQPSEICRAFHEATEQKRREQWQNKGWLYKFFNKFAANPYTEQGLFAQKDIPANTYLGTYGEDIIKTGDFNAVAEASPGMARYIAWQWEIGLLPSQNNPLMFANHSTNPNLVFGLKEIANGQYRAVFQTLCDVKAGEELLWNYGPAFEATIS